MNPLITVTVNPDGSHRISRITAHGEDVVNPSVEVSRVALALWSAVARDGLTGEWCVLNDDIRVALDRGRQSVTDPLAAHTELQRRCSDLESRVIHLEKRQRELDATPPPPPKPRLSPQPPRGQ